MRGLANVLKLAGLAERLASRLPLRVGAAIAVVLMPGTATAQQSNSAQDASAVTLPEIRVISTSPMPPARPAAGPPITAGASATAAETAAQAAVPGAVDRDKIPSNVQVLSASDFSHTVTPDLLQSMLRALPGVALSDQTGNQFQLDLNYRGFIASPVIGTPQGIAVYQNGVRINETFGDIVNWDFIPENAISRMTLVPSNPVFGLNAIGGALSVEMKNGFTYQGLQGEVNGGSYGRIGTSVQAGGQVGNLSGYIAADAIDDAGWRTNSPSSVRRVYMDLGARGDQTEFHVTFTGANNSFGAAAATPVQMLAQDWSSIYTVPQTTENQLAFLTASASWKPTDTWTYQANFYFRNFNQAHVDGNGTDADNTPGDCPNPALICFPNLNGTFSNLRTTAGQTVPNAGFLGSSILGEIDRTWTNTNSFGGSVQAASSEKLFGHDNNFVVGVSVDRGLVQFSTTSELGTVNANQFPVVQGVGLFIDQPSGDVAPVGLGATTLYSGRLRNRHVRRHAAAVGHRRRALQLCPDHLDRRARQRPVAQWQPRLQPFQSDDRRDIQDHAEFHGLRRFRGGEPGADAAGARLLEPVAALPDRQRAGRRSQPQSGRYLHLRGRPARTFRHRRGSIELVCRRLSRAQHRRHHQRREPDTRTRILSERRQHAAPRRRGQRELRMGSLERLCQFHLRRRDVSQLSHSVVAESIRSPTPTATSSSFPAIT